MVKTQLVKRGARGLHSLPAATAYELRYMEKGDRGHEAYGLYQAQDQAVDQQAFAQRTRHDPHQWRIVLSPERGDAVDLTSVTRRAMAQMEKDTGYQLDWVAANHYDTAHPHTHIVMRGLDKDGQEVGLRRDYIARGFHYRTQDILTQDLGERVREPDLDRTENREQTVELAEDLDRVWDRPLIANRTSGIYHTPEQANYGDVHPKNQERFWTEREAQAAGFRRAENDHYGPGTGLAQEAQAGRYADMDAEHDHALRTTGQGRGLGLSIASAVPREAPVGGGGVKARLRDPEYDRDR
jgi:type IV secretory pathway VirD2 relaxase